MLGHREPDISVEHRISHESLGRLHRAEWVARRRPTLAAVLTGYTSTGGLSEAEQMRAAWRVADVPPLLEVGGRDTAENATRSLPIVLALGEVRSATIVTSAWHLRAPYHFLAWRDAGIDVDFAFDWRGDWPRMLAHESRACGRARRPRASAGAGALAFGRCRRARSRRWSRSAAACSPSPSSEPVLERVLDAARELTGAQLRRARRARRRPPPARALPDGRDRRRDAPRSSATRRAATACSAS